MDKKFVLTSYKCHRCPAVFQLPTTLHDHKQVSHVPGGKFKCPECPCQFKVQVGLTKHQEIYHSQVEAETACMANERPRKPKGKISKCLHCSQAFMTTKSLQKHMRLHTVEDFAISIDPTILDPISHTEKTLTASNKAENVKNSKEELLQELAGGREIADFLVVELDEYCDDDDEHVDNTVDVKATHKCNECGKILSSLLCLRNHQTIHTGEKPWICSLCGAAFRLNSMLSRHAKVSHVEAGSHKCEKCSCVFASFVGLVRHKRLFHGKSQMMTKKAKQAKIKTVVKLPVQVPLEEEAKEEESENMEVWDEGGNDQAEGVDDTTEDADDKSSYKCNQCGKVLSSLLCLRNHEMIHTGEKPWICGLCGAAFRLNSMLYGHKKTAHILGGKQCSMCNCSFISLQALKAHAAKAHGRSDVSSLKVQQPVLATVQATHGSSDHLSCVDDKPHQLAGSPIKAPADDVDNQSLKNHQLQCGQDDVANLNSSCREIEDEDDWKLNPSVCKVVVEQLEQGVLDHLEKRGFVYICPKTQAPAIGDQSGPKVKLNFRKREQQRIAIGDLARGQKCPDCSKYFRSSDDLRFHRKAVHELSGKIQPSPKIVKRNGKFGCSVCKTLDLYLSRQGAEQHIIRVHTPSKLCPHCDGTFSSVSTLNRHISTKHLKTKRQAGFRRTLTNVRRR